jgi:hypothetical protein
MGNGIKDAIEDLPEPIGTEIRTKEEAPNDLHLDVIHPQ